MDVFEKNNFNEKMVKKDMDAVINRKIHIIVGVLVFASVLVLFYYGAIKHVSDINKMGIGMLALMIYAVSILYFLVKTYNKLVEYSVVLVILSGIVVSPLSLIASFSVEKYVDNLNIGVASAIFIVPLLIIGVLSGGASILTIIFLPLVIAKAATIKAVKCTAKMTAKAVKGMGASDDVAGTIGAVVGVAAGAAIGAEIGSVVRDSMNSTPTVDKYTDASSIDTGSIGNAIATMQPDVTSINSIDFVENDIAGVDSDMTSTIESDDSVVNFADSMWQADGTAVVHADDSVDLLDSNMQSAGHITDGGMILNSLNLPDGRIEGNNIFDAQNQLAYTIEGDTIYNKLHQVAFIIRDGNVYGNTNQLLSRTI